MAWPYYVYAGALVFAFFVAQKVGDYISAARFQKKHGCKAPRRIPQWERIIGYSLYRTQVKAQKEKRLLSVSQKRFNDYGATWSAMLLGKCFPPKPSDLMFLFGTLFILAFWIVCQRQGILRGSGAFPIQRVATLSNANHRHS